MFAHLKLRESMDRRGGVGGRREAGEGAWVEGRQGAGGGTSVCLCAVNLFLRHLLVFIISVCSSRGGG